MIGGFSVKFIGTLSELFIPMLLAYMIDDVVPLRERKWIVVLGGAMLICAAIAFFGNVNANRIAAGVARDTVEKIRNDLFSRISYLSARQLDRFTIPSLESRITTDTYNVHSFVSMMQRMGVRAPILLVGGILITLFMDSYLALAMIAVLPFIFVTVYFISRKGVPLYTKVQRSVDRMIRVVREDTQGIRVIK